MKKEIAKPYDITYIKAIEAARNCNFNIKSESLTDGIISFKVRISIWSWGETFYIKFTKVEQNLTQIEVSSQNNQVGSWGKHEQNISDFFSNLNSLLKK